MRPATPKSFRAPRNDRFWLAGRVGGFKIFFGRIWSNLPLGWVRFRRRKFHDKGFRRWRISNFRVFSYQIVCSVSARFLTLPYTNRQSVKMFESATTERHQQEPRAPSRDRSQKDVLRREPGKSSHGTTAARRRCSRWCSVSFRLRISSAGDFRKQTPTNLWHLAT